MPRNNKENMKGIINTTLYKNVIVENSDTLLENAISVQPFNSDALLWTRLAKSAESCTLTLDRRQGGRHLGRNPPSC